MTTTTIECIECGETVPYGRLSCPACGALLAAVKRTLPSIDQPAAAPAYLIEPVPLTVAPPEPEAPPTPWPPFVAPDPDPGTGPWTADDQPEASLVARPYGRVPSGGSDGTGRVAPPGAYLPPSSARPVASSNGTAVAASTTSGTTVAGAAGATAVGIRDALPRVDAARLSDVAGWFVVAGSAMAALGFLLPWSFSVIGSRGSGGYLDDWGLASPTHVLALAAVLVVLALGIVQTTVPIWLRTGVLGLALGGILVGLTWPYALGPLGADIGAMLTLLGGLALVIGGGLATWSERHAGEGPPV